MIEKPTHQLTENILTIAGCFNLDADFIINEIIDLNIMDSKTYLATDFAINNNYAINTTDSSIQKMVDIITGIPKDHPLDMVMTPDGIDYVKNNIPNYFDLIIDQIILNLEIIKKEDSKNENIKSEEIFSNALANHLIKMTSTNHIDIIYSNNKKFSNFQIKLITKMNNQFNNIISQFHFYDDIKIIQHKLNLEQTLNFKQTENKTIIKI